ncbi:MAG TPA: PIN domain-containing protein [Steroidobacteraceae bacterium]
MAAKRLILDANILARAVLGVRVRSLIGRYAADVAFFVPENASAEAQVKVTAAYAA